MKTVRHVKFMGQSECDQLVLGWATSSVMVGSGGARLEQSILSTQPHSILRVDDGVLCCIHFVIMHVPPPTDHGTYRSDVML